MSFVAPFCHKYENFFLSLHSHCHLLAEMFMCMQYRKWIFVAVAGAMSLTAQAQSEVSVSVDSVCVDSLRAESYLVYTKSAKPEEKKTQPVDSVEVTKDKAREIMDAYFPYKSLCDWQKGMLFMVRPDKRDLVVRVFTDSIENKKVSSYELRNKIFEYTWHVDVEKHGRVCFRCIDNGKTYYYEVPSGDFNSYCGSKYGVPALAYLGDVDVARKMFQDKELITKTFKYFRDTSYGSDNFEPVDVEMGMRVKVVKIGVGSRSFPVKIIVVDSVGREFYREVAISRINSGLRADEFNLMDNQHHTFETAFDLYEEKKVPQRTTPTRKTTSARKP